MNKTVIMALFGLLTCGIARAEDKFVFAIRYFQSDRDVAEISNLVVRATKAGYTGLALVSGRDYTGNWWDGNRPDDRTPAFRAAHAALDAWWIMSPDRQRRVKEVAQICAANGLELVPFVWSVGYNSMRYAEPDVAASVACEFREVEPIQVALDLDGTFDGTAESRTLSVTAPVAPKGLYRITGEVKTDHLHWSECGGYGCGARCVVSDPEDNGDVLAFVSAKGKATRDWTPFVLEFASGNRSLVKIEVGRWWDASGSCAFRNLKLQQIACTDWVTRGGERMTRKWFADRQSSACMSDPRLAAYFRTSAAAIQKEFAPKKWFLSMDEIRVDCECAACRKVPFSERLGTCLRAQCDAIRAVCPDATIYVWSDMLDPGHNCRGGDPLASLPRDVVIALWDSRRIADSVAYFTGRGHRVLGAGYYDLDNAKAVRANYAIWKRALDASGKSAGIMYTTWTGFQGCTEGDYRFLEDFQDAQTARPMPERGLCAHRGDRAAFPENTVLSFKSAAAKGAAMVEFDVWRCKTGELVVLHDRTVDRTTTGTGAVECLSFDYLRSLDAGIKRGKRFRGTKIPTFDEAVDCLPKEGIWINIHCKDNVCDEVARKLKAKGRLHQAFVASAPKGVRAARKAVPEVKTCLMTGPWGRVWTDRMTSDYVSKAVANRYDFAQPHCCALRPEDEKRFHGAGGKFNFFWLSDPEKLPGLFSTGVDFPLVDDLDTMLAAYAAWEKAGCPKAAYVPDTVYDGDIVSGNDWPTLAGTAWIEREVADACASNATLQAALGDRVSLDAYRGLVRAIGGTNIWTTALQKALDEHEIVKIPASGKIYYVDAPVLVPSNRRIEATGATVGLLPGTRTLLLRNKNAKDGTFAPIPSGSRDTNIAIVGGVWTDWMDRRAGYGSTGAFDLSPRRHGNFFGVSTLFFFNNCDHVSVTDATFRRCSAFAVQAGDGTAHRYERIRFDDCFADGLHLNGNLSRVLCRDVRGKVGDDLIALNAYDWLNSSVDFGPQEHILCEDLELRLKDGKGYPAIRILPGKYRYAPSNVVDCVISDVIFRRVKGIKAFKMYLQTPPYRVGEAHEWTEVGSGGNLYFEDIAIDLDAPIDNFGAYASSDPVRGHFGAFEFGANLSSVSFRNIDIAFHADKWPMSHLAMVGPKSVCDGTWETFDPYVSCTVKRVTLDGVRVSGAVPKELVRAVSFDDVNRDGASSGRGRILRTVEIRRR